MHTPVRLPAIRKHLQRLGARAERSLPVALMRRFIETDLMTQAASLSFYALLSLAPLLILLLWLTASLYPPAQQSLLDQIGQLAGSDAAAVATTVIRNADARPDLGSLAGLWSTALLLVGATLVFAQLQGALNLIFRTDAQRLNGLVAWLKKRVFSLGVVLAIGFLLIVSMIATTALQVAFARLPSLLPVLGYTSTLLLCAGLRLLLPLPAGPARGVEAGVPGRRHHGAAVRRRALPDRPLPGRSGTRKRVRIDGRAGADARVDLLRQRGVLRRGADHSGDRRAQSSRSKWGGVRSERKPLFLTPSNQPACWSARCRG